MLVKNNTEPIVAVAVMVLFRADLLKAQTVPPAMTLATDEITIFFKRENYSIGGSGFFSSAVPSKISIGCGSISSALFYCCSYLSDSDFWGIFDRFSCSSELKGS